MKELIAFQALVISVGCSSSGVEGSPRIPGGSAPLASETRGVAGGGGSLAGSTAGGVVGQGGMKAGAVTPDAGASVLERNGGPSRAGHFIQPSLTKMTVAKMLLERSFMAPFAGDMWASPLYLENGPGGKGVIFAVTASNDVHALDEKTGAIIWSTRTGSSPAAPCGDVHPLGILGTPVIDLASRTIYVAGAIGQATIERHEVHALSVDDGKERNGWPIDVGKISVGKFNAPAQNQRGALSLVNGVLYVPYGGHSGECGDYRGWVFAIDTANPTVAKGWATSGAGEGIGASGGMASDGNGVFAVTGKSAMGATSHLDSQEILRITGMASANRDDQNLYYPGTWNEMDRAGVDFGSNNPILVEVPGATPSTFVAATSGDGHLYLLDSKKLGGIGGHVVDFKVATGTTAIRTAPTVYSTSKGIHIAITASSGVSCPAGSPAPPVGNTGQVVLSVLIPPGAPPKPEIAWCYYLIQGQGSPVSTTTDGRADAIVWFMNDVKLLGLDGDTGREVFDGTHDISGIPFAERTCPGVHPWTSPIAVKGRMIVAANGRLCSWAPQ